MNKQVKQIWIYTDTAKKIKKLAVEEDTTMQELADKAIKEYLERRGVN